MDHIEELMRGMSRCECGAGGAALELHCFIFDNTPMYYVVCDQCHNGTGWGDSADNAIAAWNAMNADTTEE